MTEQMNNASGSNSGAIGYIVGGGLKANLQARLSVPAQTIQEGAFVVIESGSWLFYGLVTDLQLGSTDPRFADEQTGTRLPPQLAKLLHGQTLYTNLEILTALMMEQGPEPGSPEYDAWFQQVLDEKIRPEPVKTVPQHHAVVRLASAGDIAEIFGKEGKGAFFRIGDTLEGGHPVCMELDKLVQRSAGIFGATGTGKSFLARVIISGLIQRDKTAVLIFDMHNEYGPDDTASDTGMRVPGLKNKFSSKVRMVGLGRGATIRGEQPDYTLEIAESDITPEDILMLSQELNLRETTPATLNALVNSFGKNWFHEFKQLRPHAVEENEDGKTQPAEDSIEAWANKANIHQFAAIGLHSKLNRLFDCDYIVEEPAADALKQVISNLDNDQHVVLSFGKHEKDLDYLFVSNLLTRRIRNEWQKRTNAFRSGKGGAAEPRQLVIVVEEAHKLLNREMASQTTFSTIAREMRKYYVTLLIIDQRPSQIYDEVMSQLGTRVSGWLGDSDDIHAVLTGLAGREALRGMLARLQPKEEVLILGWGVPMPIVVHSRRYDDAFWDELLGRQSKRSNNEILDELGY
ncbi:MAG: ATP-binding protein [Chloroflexota bacterium]|nr:ATP-binding protein [Chloroflexota bacterium]